MDKAPNRSTRPYANRGIIRGDSYMITEAKMRKSHAMLLGLTGLTALLLLVVPIAHAQTPKKGPAVPRLVVKGTLQRPDGSPATGVIVYLFPYLDNKLSTWLTKVGEKWEIANPSATTDAKGQFVIRFTEAEITERVKTREFAVGTFLFEARPLVNKDNGASLILSIDNVLQEGGTFDLSKVFKGVVFQ
jgi:hypothetical protein